MKNLPKEYEGMHMTTADFEQLPHDEQKLPRLK
jgi:hypothetical protein